MSYNEEDYKDEDNPEHFTPDDLSNLEQFNQPQEWVFDNCIPIGGITLLSGRGGVGKSTLARTLALSALLGKTLIPSIPRKEEEIGFPCPVVLLSGEDSAQTVIRNLFEIAASYEISNEVLEPRIKDYLTLVTDFPYGGQLLDSEDGALYPSQFYVELLATCQRFSEPKPVVIIDPLCRFYGLSENDNQHADKFMATCSKLVADGCSLILVHHTSKRAGDSRGATGFRNGSLVAWIMEERPRGALLVHDKNKPGAKSKDIPLEFRGAVLHELAEYSSALDAPVLDWITNNPQVLSLGALKLGCTAAAKDIIAGVGSREHIAKAIHNLIKIGKVKEVQVTRTNGSKSKMLAPTTT